MKTRHDNDQTSVKKYGVDLFDSELMNERSDLSKKKKCSWSVSQYLHGQRHHAWQHILQPFERFYFALLNLVCNIASLNYMLCCWWRYTMCNVGDVRLIRVKTSRDRWRSQLEQRLSSFFLQINKKKLLFFCLK